RPPGGRGREGREGGDRSRRGRRPPPRDGRDHGRREGRRSGRDRRWLRASRRRARRRGRRRIEAVGRAVRIAAVRVAAAGPQMTVVGLAHRNRRALFVLLGLLLAAGASALFTSARSIYPRLAFPRIAMIAERGEAPVKGMMMAVTRPLEQAVSTVP